MSKTRLNSVSLRKFRMQAGLFMGKSVDLSLILVSTYGKYFFSFLPNVYEPVYYHAVSK